MANENKIDHINYGGTVYEFVDAAARNNVNTLSTRVTNLNNSQTAAVNAEKLRAEGAEQALENSKVSIVAGKGLSKNDFTDEYKALLDSPVAFVGATEDEDGEIGQVPAPEAGDEDKYLKGDGTWAEVDVPEYADATHSTHGLMPALDKLKLDGMDPEPDEWQSSSVVWSSNNTVATETLGNGRTKTTTFNSNGTITEVIAKTGSPTITLTTTFNNDGSITRTRSTT